MTKAAAGELPFFFLYLYVCTPTVRQRVSLMDHCQGSPCLIISGSIGVRCLFIDGERAEKGARCDKYHDRTLLIGSPARALVIKLDFCNQAGDSLGRQCELIPLYAGVFCCLFDASRAGRRSALCLRKTPTPRDIYEKKRVDALRFSYLSVCWPLSRRHSLARFGQFFRAVRFLCNVF